MNHFDLSLDNRSRRRRPAQTLYSSPMLLFDQIEVSIHQAMAPLVLELISVHVKADKRSIYRESILSSAAQYQRNVREKFGITLPLRWGWIITLPLEQRNHAKIRARPIITNMIGTGERRPLHSAYSTTDRSSGEFLHSLTRCVLCVLSPSICLSFALCPPKHWFGPRFGNA